MGEGPRERGHGQEGGEPQSQGSRVAGRGKGRWFQFSCPRPGFLSTSMWKSPRSYHQSITSNSAKVQGLGGWENQGDLGLGGLNSAPWPSPSFQLEGNAPDCCPPPLSPYRLCPLGVYRAGGTPLL